MELHEPRILHPLLVQVVCQTVAMKVDTVQYYMSHVILGIGHLWNGEWEWDMYTKNVHTVDLPWQEYVRLPGQLEATPLSHGPGTLHKSLTDQCWQRGGGSPWGNEPVHAVVERESHVS